MIDTLLSLLAPHYCYGCNQLGSIFCDNCKYNIISEPYSRCIACKRPTGQASGVCGDCQTPYQRAWCVGERTEGLERLIGAYKFNYAKAAHVPLAELLHAVLPELPQNTIIVPIPTVASHVRQRGYDHTLLLVRHLAGRRQLPTEACIRRATTTTQRGASRRQRIKQAQAAFVCTQTLDPSAIYLLVDDVVTTGATIASAARVLTSAGAQTVWVATVSRQPATADRCADRAL